MAVRTKRAPYGDATQGDIFSAASARAAFGPPKANEKGTTWQITDPDVIEEIENVVYLQEQLDALEKRLDTRKANLKAVADRRYFQDGADLGEFPAGPIKMVTPRGKSVGFVAQDCSDGAEVKKGVLEALHAAAGWIPVPIVDLVEPKESFAFNNEVLNERLGFGTMTVRDFLAAVIAREVGKGSITRDQADRLIECQRKTVFKAGLFKRLLAAGLGNWGRLTKLFGAIGSLSKRYIKT
jgi:hypothetical protein